MTSPLVYEKVWFDKPKFEAAEKQYYERLAKVVFGSSINGPALNSTAISAMQPLPKVFPLMDKKVCCNAEKYTGALNGNENNVQKQGIDLGGILKTTSPAMGDVSSAHPDTTVKEEKRSKKEKKIRNKEKKRDIKKQQISNKLGEQDTIETKNNANSVPSMTKPITIPNNTASSPFNKGKDGNLCDKYEGNETTGGLEIMGCPTMNTKCVKVCDPSGGVQEADVSAKVWLGGKSCILENYSTNVREVDPRKVFKKGSSNSPMKDSLASEVAKARQHIKQSLECMDDIAAMAGNNSDLTNRINSLEKENADLKKIVEDLKNLALGLESRVKILEGGKSAPAHTPAPAKTSKNEDDDDDGVDLFGSDSEEESEEAARIKEQRLAAYAEKKSKKPALIAKSNIILSVSPWDDETDMKKMEECVRSVKMDGLVWGASKLVPLAYGIHKLHISCVVEDDKVSVDLLQETIQEFEDYVQSADIAAFNKV